MRCATCCRVVLLGLAWLLLAAGCQQKSSDSPEESVPRRLLFPENGIYTGAYIEFGDTEDAVTLEAIEDFEQMVGKHQAVIASSSYWGEQGFPARNLHIISRHGALPLIFWSPWDKPYQENRGPDRFSLVAILDGKWDAYIDRWADEAAAFGKPLLVSWGLEMNGSWFPWSGCYYGGRGGGPFKPSLEAVTQGTEIFKDAFRYMVNRVRSRGAHNILWGFHVNNYSYPEEPWNRMGEYYPGPEYVDWLGMSVYGMQMTGDPWVSLFDAMDYPYHEICRIDPEKPVVVAEWGVGEFPRQGNKTQWIQDALEGMKARYPRIKAAVYWHERWRNEDGTYSNLKINSSIEALEAYRRGIADSHWLDRPKYGPNR